MKTKKPSGAGLFRQAEHNRKMVVFFLYAYATTPAALFLLPLGFLMSLS